MVPFRRLATLAVVGLLGTPQFGSAQSAASPSDGGLVVSLGQPPNWHWQAGLAAGAWFEGPGSQLLVRASTSTYHDIFNPVVGMAQVGAEGFVGLRDTQFDGGVRALFRVPFIGLGVGGEYDFLDGRVNFLVTAQTPIIRGGVLVPGGTLRIVWYPSESSSFTAGFSMPLGDPYAGRGRPTSEYVVATRKFPRPVSYVSRDPTIEAVLDTLRESADWMRRLTVPFLDQDGRNFAIAQERNDSSLAALRAHITVRSVDQEMRLFHRAMERAFALAAGNGDAGRQLAAEARATLLEDILLPYDGLLGRKQWRDELGDLVIIARGHFGGKVAAGDLAPPGRVDSVLYVFQQLTGILQAQRTHAAEQWNDPRLTWLPLQYALLPEDYDSQAELDRLVERATKVDFTDGNRIRYIANLQFHSELMQTIRDAKYYHVLLIHDFPAVTPTGRLDWASLAQVIGYINTLTDRVREYDWRGTLPIYFIFLDQHYYELRKAHIWMDVLQDPLHASAKLEHATPDQTTALATALGALRAAVDNSTVLQAEARQYGDAWLRNRIKVQVNITNRADETFWSGGVVSSFFAYPDNLMRDHRKVAFYDVTEADPYRRRAVYTGMGVGQQYLGPGWEDRSVMVTGPMLVELKTAVRELLVAQGMPDRDVPQPLRVDPRPLGYDSILAAGQREDSFTARAVQLTNGTGFQAKPLDVAKALLYSLMPPGSVIKIPDSLWNSFLYAGLLTGACLRGVTVWIIAPAAANAPSAGLPQMIREWELMTRLLAAREALAAPIAASGGQLKLGLYAVVADTDGLASRVQTWNREVAETPFLTDLMPFLPPTWPGVVARNLPRSPADTLRPKLHQKVQFLATRQMWEAISDTTEWRQFMAAYMAYRVATYVLDDSVGVMRPRPVELKEMAERIFARTRGVAGAAGYVMMGSQNQDYRGMFMDGEVDLLFSGPETLIPLVDLIFIDGTTTWINTQQQLDSLVPPPAEYWRRWSRVMKDMI